MKKIYVLIFGLLLSFNSKSQISQCNEPLMYGGRLRAYDKNSSCVMVATDGGLFTTTNSGSTWTNVSKDFDPYSIESRNVVNINGDFYAMSNNSKQQNIYKSTNNGANWTGLFNSSSNFWPQSLGKLGNTLYVVGGEMNGGFIYTSTDGVNWTQRKMIWNSMWMGGNVELHSFNQNRIYLEFNDSLFYTSDGNAFTAVTGSGLSSGKLDLRDNNIDGDILGNLYYSENSLYKYNFNSKSWTDISSGKIASGFQIMNVSATDNVLFVVAMSNSLGMKFYRSTNQGSTFTEVITNLPVPIVENIIEVGTNKFIGNGISDEILTSSDGGTNWTSGSSGQFIATYAGNLTRSGNALLFTRDVKGLIRSNDQGVSWNISNTGVPGFGGIAYFVEDLIAVKDTLFSIVQTDPFTQQFDFFKSVNSGNSWIPSPVTSFSGDEMLFSGKCDSTLFISYNISNSSDYAFIASHNFGKTWVKPNSGKFSGMMYFKGPRNYLYAFETDANNDWQDFTSVSVTSDFGATFTNLNPGIFTQGFEIKRVLGVSDHKGLPMMDYDLSNNKSLFVISDRMFSNGIDKIYLQNMTTHNWSEITTTGLPANYSATYIKFIGNNTWLLATNTGLYRSTNGGVKWTLTHNPYDWQNGMIVNSLQLFGTTVFMGTASNGVWIISLPLGILMPLENDKVQIYPNPSNSWVRISIPEMDNSKPIIVNMYSMDGKLMLNQTFNSSTFQMDLQNFSSGNYLLMINSGNEMFRKLISKE